MLFLINLNDQNEMNYKLTTYIINIKGNNSLIRSKFSWFVRGLSKRILSHSLFIQKIPVHFDTNGVNIKVEQRKWWAKIYFVVPIF